MRVKSIKAFSCKDVEKFFHTYKISNQKIKEIKQIFIDLIHILKQQQLIEQHLLLLSNRTKINISQLTTSNISDGIILYEKFDNNFSFL